MTPEQVVDVLTKCAAYDQRTVGEVDVMAWHEILRRIELGDALDAVRQHFTESSARAMPADIRKLAIGIRDARHGRLRQREGRLAIESAPTVSDRSAQVTALVQAVADALPKPDVYERAKAQARKQRGRPAKAEPKLRNKAKEPKDYEPPQSDDVAKLATHYLTAGHDPREVSERLYVSRRWCERTARRFKPTTEEA